MKQHNYYIYILTTGNNKVMYVGITNNLQRRLYEHQKKLIEGFTKRYNLNKLVYYEKTSDVNSALNREKEIKKWRREKKNNLVETKNPDWNDLSNLISQKISQSTNETSLLRNDRSNIIGLIIAGGFSSRMKDFKPLLKYNGKSFIHNIIDKLSTVCDKIIVVSGYNASLIEAETKAIYSKVVIHTVFNEKFADGMFSSLQTGLKLLTDDEWVLYHFVDQPNIDKNIYHVLTSELRENYDWIQPTKSKKNGHPILLGPKVIKLILSADSKSNLKNISQSGEIAKKHIEVNDDSIFFDVDTPKDFETLTLQNN